MTGCLQVCITETCSARCFGQLHQLLTGRKKVNTEFESFDKSDPLVEVWTYMLRHLQQAFLVTALQIPLLVNKFFLFALQSCTINPSEDSPVLKLCCELEASFGLEYLHGKLMMVWKVFYLQEWIACLRFCAHFVPKTMCLKINKVLNPLHSVFFQQEADLWVPDFSHALVKRQTNSSSQNELFALLLHLKQSNVWVLFDHSLQSLQATITAFCESLQK